MPDSTNEDKSKAPDTEGLGPRPQLVVTDPDEWAANELEHETTLVELPSGKVVRCKNAFSMRDLIRAGKVPNVLIDTIVGDMEQDKPKVVRTDKQRRKDADELLEFMETIFVESVVEPKVVVPDQITKKVGGETVMIDDPKWVRPKGCWSIRQFSMEDIGFVNTFLGSGASELTPFR